MSTGVQMPPEELLADLNSGESILTLVEAISKSPGFAHIKELYATFKTDLSLQEMLCRVAKLDPLKVPEMFSTIDQGLLLLDNIAARKPGWIALIERLKSHENVLWVIAKVLN